MQAMVLSIVGNDKSGLIDGIAKAVSKAQGNWLRSSFCQLAGQFAGFVEITLPKENQQALIHDCKAISNLQITLLPANESVKSDGQKTSIKVTGNDRQGIVRDVSAALTAFDVNIAELDTKCESAPNWGNQLFTATIVVETAADFDTSQLSDAIEAIADDLMVDLKTK